MTTRDKYTDVPAPFSWEVPSAGDARFTWEYDEGRARLLSLYQKGKMTCDEDPLGTDAR
jgi:hypothetical protein